MHKQKPIGYVELKIPKTSKTPKTFKPENIEKFYAKCMKCV